MAVMTGIVAIYYTVIMSWTLYYFAMSFSATLPWSTCNNDWNSESCFMRLTRPNSSVAQGNQSVLAINGSDGSLVLKTPTEEFWE